MELEGGLAPSIVIKDYDRCFWVCTSEKFNQKGLKKFILGQFLI